MAYGVSIGSDWTYGWEDQSTILVTVSTELNIVVCASENNPARYIDILHDQIESVSLEKRSRVSQLNPLELQNLDILVIWLTRSSDKTLYLGAGKRFAPLINIAFTSVDEATAVMKRLLRCATHVIEKFTCSESEPLNLSQPMVGKVEEQGMPGGAVAQADEIRPAIVTSATESVSLPTFIREPESDLAHAFSNWPKNISTGLLRTTDLNDLRSDTGISIEDIQADNVVSYSHSPIKNLKDMSEGSLRNSAEWRKGAMLIETAPELQDKNDGAMEEGDLSEKRSPAAKITFIKRDGDPDGFYNTAPESPDPNIEREEQISTHSEERPDIQRALEHTLVHMARNLDMVEDFNAEVGRDTVAVAAELDVQARKNQEHVNGNTAEIRKLGVKKRYTCKKKLPATNASKFFKKIAIGKSQADRNAESLSDKTSRLHRGQKEKDEFDFPLSPQKMRTPKNIRPPIFKKFPPKEGAIGLPPEKEVSTYRPFPPDKVNPLVRNMAAWDNHPVILPSTAAFEPTKATGPNDELAGINWDEGLVLDQKLNGADSNPVGKRLPRNKAKSVTKRNRNKDDEAYSIKKGLRENVRKANKKTRSAPPPRRKRAAALIADQKIKNSINCDTSQEQNRSGLTHDVQTSRASLSQEAISPNGLANNNHPNIDRGESQQTKPQNLFKMVESKILDHDGAPEVIPVSKLRPHDGEIELLASSHATELARNQHRQLVILPQPSILRRIPVYKTNGTLDHDNGNGRAEEAHLAGSTAFTARPVGHAYNAKEEDETDNKVIAHRNYNIENGSKVLSVIYLESSHSESPAPLHPRMPNGAQEACSSEGLVSALELPDSPGYSRTGITPTSSMIHVDSSKSRRFLEFDGKRRAASPKNSHQKGKNGLNQRAAAPIATTTPSKPGNTFASSLKKALSGLQMSVGNHSAPESRIQGRSAEQDKMGLDVSLVRPSTSSPVSQIPVAGGFRNDNQSRTLKRAGVDPDMSTSEALQEGNKRPKRLNTTVSPWRSPQDFHSTENSIPLHEQHAFSCEYSENENEEKVLSKQARRTPMSPKQPRLQPIHTPHRIRRASSRERLHARAINSWATPTKAFRDVNRKSNLISFDSRGPRNQGMIPTQKDQLASSSQPEPSLALAADRDRSLKRKLSLGAGESSALERTDLAYGKRLRISTGIPKEQDVAQHRSSILTDVIHRPSSQSTRVNEYGSPMPSVRSRHFVFRDHGRRDPTKIGKSPRLFLDDDQDDPLAPGDRVETENDISASKNRLSKTTKISWRTSSASSKRKRYLRYLQSPKTNQFTAHVMHPHGGFVDVHTETEILPIRPPDPFTESRKIHQNAFMEMLRRSSNLLHKSSLNDRLGLPSQKFDKALDENHVNSPSTESLSSNSSSCERLSSSSESSSDADEEGLYEEESWLDRLEPHQKGQLDALYDISNVNRIFPQPKS